jgi:hypothetical protein
MRRSFIPVAGLLTSVSFSLAASYAAHEKVKLKTQGGSHVMPSLSEERPSIFYRLETAEYTQRP